MFDTLFEKIQQTKHFQVGEFLFITFFGWGKIVNRNKILVWFENLKGSQHYSSNAKASQNLELSLRKHAI